MGDENDWKKLSTEDKCEHKVIKYILVFLFPEPHIKYKKKIN